MTRNVEGNGDIQRVREPSAGMTVGELSSILLDQSLTNRVKQGEAIRVAEGETPHVVELERDIVSDYKKKFSHIKNIDRLTLLQSGVPKVATSLYMQLLMYRAIDERIADMVHNSRLTFKQPSDLAALKIALGRFNFHNRELRGKLLGDIQESAGGMWV